MYFCLPPCFPCGSRRGRAPVGSRSARHDGRADSRGGSDGKPRRETTRGRVAGNRNERRARMRPEGQRAAGGVKAGWQTKAKGIGQGRDSAPARSLKTEADSLLLVRPGGCARRAYPTDKGARPHPLPAVLSDPSRGAGASEGCRA